MSDDLSPPDGVSEELCVCGYGKRMEAFAMENYAMANQWAGWLHEAEARYLGAEVALARVDARHQPKQTGRWVACHSHSPRDPDCPRCAGSAIFACVQDGCGPWPCGDHLAVHGETKEVCVHA